MKHKILILERKIIARIINIRQAVEVVERAFYAYGRGGTRMPAKIYLSLDKYRGDFRAMPAYIEGGKSCSLKWVNVHPYNNKFGLPAVMAVIILSDPRNGLPLCVMDGTYITALRTGAAGAVAAKYLARDDSNVAGLVGCGAQARAALMALYEIFPLRRVKIWGRTVDCTRRFIHEMKRKNVEITAVKTIKECVRDSDIIVTTTPSRSPLVEWGWLKAGAHINAIGADAPGKEELSPEIIKKAKVVVDSWEQAAHSGEINVPLSNGWISKKDIYADIGEVVCAKKKGRKNRNEITVFDSTGLAIQDAAVADFVYQSAMKKGLGKWVGLF